MQWRQFEQGSCNTVGANLFARFPVTIKSAQNKFLDDCFGCANKFGPARPAQVFQVPHGLLIPKPYSYIFEGEDTFVFRQDSTV